MRYERTPSKFYVTPLDLTVFRDEATAWLKEQGALKDNYFVRDTYETALVEAKDGKHYLVNTEGCGTGIALEDGGGELDWYTESLPDEKGTVTCGMIPACSTTFDYEELKAKTTPLPAVRFDKFVRVFGDRLDRNYGNWERFLETGEV